MAGENLHRPSPPFSYVTMKSSNFEFFCARPVLTDSFDQTVRKTVRRFLRPLLHFLLHCPTNCTATDSPLKNFHFQLVADFRGYCQRFFAEVKTAKVIASHRRMCFDVANPFWTTSMGPWKKKISNIEGNWKGEILNLADLSVEVNSKATRRGFSHPWKLIEISLELARRSKQSSQRKTTDLFPN